MANVRHPGGPGSHVIWFAPMSSSFSMGGPSSLARSGGDVLGAWCMASQLFCHWREPVVSRFLGHNR
jgi:hypothetical protein